MDVDEATFAHPPQDAAPEPYTAEWWQARTPNELRDIIKRGFGLGQAYDGAVLETERRAREAMRRIRDEAQQAQQRKTKAQLIFLGGTLALLIVLVIVVWLTR